MLLILLKLLKLLKLLLLLLLLYCYGSNLRLGLRAVVHLGKSQRSQFGLDILNSRWILSVSIEFLYAWLLCVVMGSMCEP